MTSGLNARVDHTGIVVPDLETAADFFERLFGARVLFRLEPGPVSDPGPTRLGARAGARFALAMLELAGGRLELLQWWPCLEADPEHPVTAPNVRGGTHLGLEVDDVAAALERLSAEPGVSILSGVETFSSGPTPGLSNAFLRTPWGLLIELLTWP